MKAVLTFAAILAVASAQFNGFGRATPRPTNAPPRPAAPSRVASSDQTAQIIKLDNDISPDGAFFYDVETDNGISLQARGTPRDFGGNPPIVPVVIDGAYAFTAPGGERISLTYVADENGYQPSGDALPTPHPIPEAIARALDYLAKNAPSKKK